MLHRTSLAGYDIPGVGCATQATSHDNFVKFWLMETMEERAHARTWKYAVMEEKVPSDKCTVTCPPSKSYTCAWFQCSVPLGKDGVKFQRDA